MKSRIKTKLLSIVVDKNMPINDTCDLGVHFAAAYFCQNVLKQIKQSGVLSMYVNYNTAHE